MRLTPASGMLWITGFLTVVSLYAHTLVGLPSVIVTPVLAGMIAASLWLVGVLEAGRLRINTGHGALRTASMLCLALSLIMMSASALVGFADRGVKAQEVGVFAIQVGIPVLVALNPRRLELIKAISMFCIAFASADLLANVLALFHIVDLSHYSGRLTEAGVVIRYPGLSGNTHASGLVAMIAIVALSFRASRPGNRFRLVQLIIIAALFCSLILVDARRYLVEAAVGAVVILIPVLRRVPSLILVATIAGSALWATFRNVLDPLDDTRARLMIHGFYRALNHPVLGNGATYVPPSYDQPGYENLAAAGVTESGILDLAIAYGMPAALLFYLACLLVIIPPRRRLSLPLIMATLLAAEMAYGTPISGFLGAILFFLCIIFLQQDEKRYEEAEESSSDNYNDSLKRSPTLRVSGAISR